MKLDPIQRQILSVLQKDSHISTQQLAERIGLSSSPCWRRVRELEEAGLIKGYVALLDRKKLGLDACVWIHIRLKKHSAEALERFESQVKGYPQVVECYELLGENDCLLKVYLSGVEELSAFMHNLLLKIPEVDAVRTSVALREIKNETALPL
jgi:DNA-binding Lrp family transcriptional regulator